ncbi:hypothetical protein RDWZM_003101 [Blomia tropicalis]|uniref:Uncharacterized protein n=1 Tax=Blomia tropicalis TaxID=40697 RepID=A0A9Q0RS82_BLOTA|nr:hypothetical protein RDWZM_003101 [Blomia tropicalis]
MMREEKEMIGGCCVCSDDVGYDDNPIVYCDGEDCTVGIHQACYGIQSVPADDWFCRPCEAGVKNPRCELCPSKIGALKPTNNQKWAHVICSLYIPEIKFGSVRLMEPIILDHLNQERCHLRCVLCEKDSQKISQSRYGATVKCDAPHCTVNFHVTCAQAYGLLCEESEDGGDSIIYHTYCLNHIQKARNYIPNIHHIPAYRWPPKSTPTSPNNNHYFDMNHDHKTSSLNLSSASSSSSSLASSPIGQAHSSTKKSSSNGDSISVHRKDSSKNSSFEKMSSSNDPKYSNVSKMKESTALPVKKVAPIINNHINGIISTNVTHTTPSSSKTATERFDCLVGNGKLHLSKLTSKANKKKTQSIPSTSSTTARKRSFSGSSSSDSGSGSDTSGSESDSDSSKSSSSSVKNKSTHQRQSSTSSSSGSSSSNSSSSSSSSSSSEDDEDNDDEDKPPRNNVNSNKKKNSQTADVASAIPTTSSKVKELSTSNRGEGSKKSKHSRAMLALHISKEKLFENSIPPSLLLFKRQSSNKSKSSTNNNKNKKVKVQRSSSGSTNNNNTSCGNGETSSHIDSANNAPIGNREEIISGDKVSKSGTKTKRVDKSIPTTSNNTKQHGSKETSTSSQKVLVEPMLTNENNLASTIAAISSVGTSKSFSFGNDNDVDHGQTSKSKATKAKAATKITKVSPLSKSKKLAKTSKSKKGASHHNSSDDSSADSSNMLFEQSNSSDSQDESESSDDKDANSDDDFIIGSKTGKKSSKSNVLTNNKNVAISRTKNSQSKKTVSTNATVLESPETTYVTSSGRKCSITKRDTGSSPASVKNSPSVASTSSIEPLPTAVTKPRRKSLSTKTSTKESGTLSTQTKKNKPKSVTPNNSPHPASVKLETSIDTIAIQNSNIASTKNINHNPLFSPMGDDSCTDKVPLVNSSVVPFDNGRINEPMTSPSFISTLSSCSNLNQLKQQSPSINSISPGTSSRSTVILKPPNAIFASNAANNRGPVSLPTHIDRPPTPKTIEDLLEFQFVNTAHFLLTNPNERYDVADLFANFNEIKMENSNLERDCSRLQEKVQQQETINAKLHNLSLMKN